MKQQNPTPSVRRFALALYGGIFGGLLILALSSWHLTSQIEELERHVDEFAAEQERTLREAEQLLDMLEGLEHDFELADPARFGEGE